MIRSRSLMARLSAALMVLVITSVVQAQPPGGGGGRGGFGGPGGGRGNVFGLLQEPAVQEDLKLTDKQKADIKTVNDTLDKKRQELFGNFGGRNQNNNNNAQSNGNTPANSNSQTGATGTDPNAQPPQRPDRATMQANFQQLQTMATTAFSKILTKAQRERLDQIELRRAGPMAIVTRPELQIKLNLSDDQIDHLQEIQGQMRATMNQTNQARREIMASFRNPDGSQPDRATRQTLMNSPEVKAQMSQIQQQGNSVRSEADKAIMSVLSKKQKASLQKMLGKPFDLSKLTNNGRFGPGGPGGPNANANANGAPGASTADPAATTTAAPKTGTAKAKSKTAARKKSS